MQPSIYPIRALKDNYIWAIVNHQTQCAILVDPGDAHPAIEFLQQQQLTLTAILITHHHWDHTSGVPDLLKYAEIPVYGPKNDFLPIYTKSLSDQERLFFPDLDIQLKIIAIPGHTRGHIAYHGKNYLFCGDTLFSGGCGRMFEGTPQELFHSLQKLATLPDSTKVYCGHEYTVNNLHFATYVEPDNKKLQKRYQETQKMIKKGSITLPSTIGLENAINPFLRCHLPKVRRAAEQHAGRVLDDPVAVFALLRQWKDTFYSSSH